MAKPVTPADEAFRKMEIGFILTRDPDPEITKFGPSKMMDLHSMITRDQDPNISIFSPSQVKDQQSMTREDQNHTPHTTVSSDPTPPNVNRDCHAHTLAPEPIHPSTAYLKASGRYVATQEDLRSLPIDTYDHCYDKKSGQ